MDPGPFPRVLGLRRKDALQVKFQAFDASELASLDAFAATVALGLGTDLFTTSLEFTAASTEQPLLATDLAALDDGTVVTVRELPRAVADVWGGDPSSVAATSGAAGVAELLHATQLHIRADGRMLFRDCAVEPPRSRAPALADLFGRGALRTPSVGRLTSTLAHSVLASAAGLVEVGVDGAPAGDPPALASPNWATADSLWVLVPTAGVASPGLWSPLASLLVHVHDGTALPLLLALAASADAGAGPWTSSGPGSVGVLLTSPYHPAAFDAPGPADPRPRADAVFGRVWDALVARAAAPAGVVVVAHGFGADLALGVLADRLRGAAAQRRVRALALVEPRQSAGEAVMVAAAPASAAAESLRTFLRERTFAWYCDPYAAALSHTFAEDADGAAHIDGLVTHLGAPFVAADGGWHAQSVRVVVSGLPPEDARSLSSLQSVASALLPTSLAHQISA